MNLELDRVEIKHIEYDRKSRIVEEKWEFYYPPENSPKPIGFTIKPKKKC